VADLSTRATRIGSLAEPARRALYEYVVTQPEPVGREQAATALGLPPHTAKFHLDRLVESGLLDVEFRRLTGRSGPGAGRPAKLYRRAAGEVAVSLPERHYELAGSILASAVERAGDSEESLSTAVDIAAGEAGRSACGAMDPGMEPVERLMAVLAEHGFEPRRDADTVVLANCPFHALAREHTELVCGLNRSFVAGVLAGTGCDGLEARLDPEPGLCCVKACRSGG
jgi:predicted ArsR family transcriptional regulator